METEPEVMVKRVYAPAEPEDGRRVLVDRLWPRGLSKEAAAVDEWLRDVAPSTELRQAFHRGDLAFDAFERRYRDELAGGPALDELLAMVRTGRVTLLFAAKDEQAGHAHVLAAVVRERLAAG